MHHGHGVIYIIMMEDNSSVDHVEGSGTPCCSTSCQEGPDSESGATELPQAKRQRFYFESDLLALKNNPDYHKLLKTLATLEAQKVQAIKDLEVLLQAQAKAEKDLQGFMEALKSGTLEPLPTRQQIAELPEINWKDYIDSLQKVVSQRSTIYLHTRKQAIKSYHLPEKPVSKSSSKTKDPAKDVDKPASYRQPWTAEEQARFEELLRIHPPEAVERRRFEKIALALGTRTTQQVASHVQKYFIKLANAGLPVPGRMPNVAKVTRTRKLGRSRRLNKPSTFFSSLVPRVYMTDEGGGSTPGSSWEGSYYEDSSDEDSDLSEFAVAETPLTESEGSSTPMQAIKCAGCGSEVVGSYWQCSDCPEDRPTQLCTTCVNSVYRGGPHSPSHDMRLLSLSQSFTDKDYTGFTPHSAHTDYNYLDPNFFPAS